ncbi:hypothetical protein CEXT_710031 [Caerostris extrusa]|uniref:Uncharacterized protein n=1 Tax=Caerostris extrusa TaxID=172846 RepID=A0AAV4VV47_CAEEX|nr:hypothetical protein CEXT_710031 [Caerostris extrusa]
MDMAKNVQQKSQRKLNSNIFRDRNSGEGDAVQEGDGDLSIDRTNTEGLFDESFRSISNVTHSKDVPESLRFTPPTPMTTPFPRHHKNKLFWEKKGRSDRVEFHFYHRKHSVAI